MSISIGEFSWQKLTEIFSDFLDILKLHFDTFSICKGKRKER